MVKENKFKKYFSNLNSEENWEKKQRIGKLLTGFAIVLAGSLILIKQMGIHLPNWLLSWEMILIVVGFISLIKNNFKKVSGYILVLIGGTFILHDLIPEIINPRLLWPVIIIFVGFSMILKSFNNKKESLF